MPPPGVPKTLSKSNIKKSTRLKQKILSDLELDGNSLIAFLRTMGVFTLIIPRIDEIDIEFEHFFFSCLIDRNMQLELEEKNIINWCRKFKRLSPLHTLGDGNCLLHSVSLYMWGVHDSLLSLRRCVYATMAEDSNTGNIKGRWRREKLKQYSNTHNSFRLDSIEWEREWEMLVRHAEDKEKAPSAGGLPFEPLEDVHIFVVANILRRPIIVMCDSVLHNIYGSSLGENTMGGLYLPLLCAESQCCKSPIILGYDSNHFVPLIGKEWESTEGTLIVHAERVIPLVTTQLVPLALHFLTEMEEKSVSTLMNRYLNLQDINVPVNGTDQTILTAKLEYQRLPAEYDLMPDYLEKCKWSYVVNKNQEQFGANFNMENVNKDTVNYSEKEFSFYDPEKILNIDPPRCPGIPGRHKSTATGKAPNGYHVDLCIQCGEGEVDTMSMCSRCLKKMCEDLKPQVPLNQNDDLPLTPKWQAPGTPLLKVPDESREQWLQLHTSDSDPSAKNVDNTEKGITPNQSGKTQHSISKTTEISHRIYSNEDVHNHHVTSQEPMKIQSYAPVMCAFHNCAEIVNPNVDIYCPFHITPSLREASPPNSLLYAAKIPQHLPPPISPSNTQANEDDSKHLQEAKPVEVYLLETPPVPNQNDQENAERNYAVSLHPATIQTSPENLPAPPVCRRNSSVDSNCKSPECRDNGKDNFEGLCSRCFMRQDLETRPSVYSIIRRLEDPILANHQSNGYGRGELQERSCSGNPEDHNQQEKLRRQEESSLEILEKLTESENSPGLTSLIQCASCDNMMTKNKYMRCSGCLIKDYRAMKIHDDVKIRESQITAGEANGDSTVNKYVECIVAPEELLKRQREDTMELIERIPHPPRRPNGRVPIVACILPGCNAFAPPNDFKMCVSCIIRLYREGKLSLLDQAPPDPNKPPKPCILRSKAPKDFSSLSPPSSYGSVIEPAPQCTEKYCTRPGCADYDGKCGPCYREFCRKSVTESSQFVTETKESKPLTGPSMLEKRLKRQSVKQTPKEVVKLPERAVPTEHSMSMAPVAKVCKGLNCDRYGDPNFDDYCSKCYEQQKSFKEQSEQEAAFKEVTRNKQRCIRPLCENLGNPRGRGYCNECFAMFFVNR